MKTYCKIGIRFIKNTQQNAFIYNNLSIIAIIYMMKKFVSILLSFILLASHANVTFGTHFCGGEAVQTKIILGKTHLGCGMTEMEEPCDDVEKTNKNRHGFDKMPCCQNEFQTVQTTDEFVKMVASQFFHVDFAIVFISATLKFDLFPKSNPQLSTDYFPQPHEKDIQVLFQTFLI